MAIETGVLTPREPAVDLVRVISEGTYTSFPQALKEFISNAYDADAMRVDLSVDEDAGAFAIRDDGVGMTLADFRDYFASIARTGRSAARSPRGKTKVGRLKIGRFGIGALAVAGLADSFIVRSSRRNSTEGFEATIDLRELRKRFGHGEDLSRHWVFPYKRWNDEKAQSHFTEIRVEGISQDVRDVLRRPGERSADEFVETTRQLSGRDEFIWQLGIICPVAYEQSYPLRTAALDKREDSIIIRHARRLLVDRFEVYLDGRRIRRQISLPSYRPGEPKDSSKQALLEKRGIGWEIHSFKANRGSDLACDGYLVVQASQLFPLELRGMLVRLRGVAVGWHRTLSFPRAISTMLPNMSGEVWVDGLEGALQFDRESFREDHPDFVWLRDRLETEVAKAALEFRRRSARRRQALRSSRSSPLSQLPAAQPTPQRATARSVSAGFLLPEVLSGAPPYITRIVPQINGCWERQWFEACAVMIRRLLETLILHLYDQRGWIAELKDPKSQEFAGLKRMVDKLTGDGRIGLDRRAADDLKRLKELGDISAHDFRVQVKRGDLESIRDPLRFSSERLLFKARGGP